MRKYYDFFQNVDSIYEKKGILTLNDVLRVTRYDATKGHWVAASPIKHSFIKRLLFCLRYLFDDSIYMVKIE